MKQEAIDIIHEFIDWFTYHNFTVDKELMDRVDNFINGGENNG